MLEKGSVDPKVLVQSKINSDVRRAFYCSKDKGENTTILKIETFFTCISENLGHELSNEP